MVLILVSQRAEDGGPVLSEDERLQHSAACRMIVGEEDKGAGTLFVTTELVVWLNADAASASYALTYPSLNLFAVSRDPATFANKCIYCQLADEDDDGDEPSEVRFVPDDEEQLSPLYVAMTDCAVLHPDEDEDDDGGDMVFDADEVAAGAAAASSPGDVLSHLESVMTVVDGAAVAAAAPAAAPEGADASSGSGSAPAAADSGAGAGAGAGDAATMNGGAATTATDARDAAP